MTARDPTLTLADTALRALRWLNALYALGIAVLLVLSLADADWFARALGAYAEGEPGRRIAFALRGIVLVGIAGAGIAHLLLTHLVAIVASVRAGDPFVAANARRIQALAWWVLALQGLHLVVVALVRYASSPAHPFDRIGGGFSVVPWLAILLLFVLARVFDHGTRLRADLDGTV